MTLDYFPVNHPDVSLEVAHQRTIQGTNWDHKVKQIVSQDRIVLKVDV